jgi:hypothetical protein
MTLELLDSNETSYYARRPLADGRALYIFPITFGRAGKAESGRRAGRVRFLLVRRTFVRYRLFCLMSLRVR